MKFQTARKDHTCDLCDKKIPKGEKYWSHYVPPGDINDFPRKEHSNCESFAKNKD